MAQKNVKVTDTFEALIATLRSITRPIWLDFVDNTLRTKIISGTINTVTTTSTVTTVNQLAGMDAKQTLMYSVDRISWSNNVRNKIN